jgi:hypothetical protein
MKGPATLGCRAVEVASELLLALAPWSGLRMLPLLYQLSFSLPTRVGGVLAQSPRVPGALLQRLRRAPLLFSLRDGSFRARTAHDSSGRTIGRVHFHNQDTATVQPQAHRVYLARKPEGPPVCLSFEVRSNPPGLEALR